MALKQDTFSMEQLQAKYGIAAAILNADPSLVAALELILASKITDPDLQLQVLQGSNWYKTTTEDFRKYQIAQQKDPETFKADLKTNTDALKLQYKTAGIEISDADAEKYARQLMMKSQIVNGAAVTYNQAYINKLMAGSIDFSKNKTIGGTTVYDFSGTLEDLADQLYTTAFQYGYQANLSNKGFKTWMENSMRGLVSGSITKQDVDDELQKNAMSAFPGLTTQLTQGKTLREAAEPWLKAIADTWEIDMDQLDLNDDYVNKVLNSQDEKGNVTPMNLYQAKTAARKSHRWKYTERAKEEYTSMGQKILQDFGFLG